MDDGAEPQSTGALLDALGTWLASHSDVRPPLTLEPIAGGASNVTERLTDGAGQQYVLRRPPAGAHLRTAHNVAREHRIVAALGTTDVPVARTVALCDDPSVVGTPFAVYEYVEGRTLRRPEDADDVSVAARRRASREVVRALAAIHAVDVEEKGLGDLSPHDGYVRRQVERWREQYETSAGRADRIVPAVGALADRLLDRMPTQSVTALVHGDYKLDNCLVGDDGSMRAVVDWELAALGDPRADLGLLNAYWAEPDDDPPVLPSVSSAPGFLTRAELVDAYEQATGAPLRDEEYFLAFGWWKALCILESVYGRLRAREDSERTRYLGEHVLGLARSADRLLV